MESTLLLLRAMKIDGPVTIQWTCSAELALCGRFFFLTPSKSFLAQLETVLVVETRVRAIKKCHQCHLTRDSSPLDSSPPDAKIIAREN